MSVVWLHFACVCVCVCSCVVVTFVCASASPSAQVTDTAADVKAKQHVIDDYTERGYEMHEKALDVFQARAEANEVSARVSADEASTHHLGLNLPPSPPPFPLVRRIWTWPMS